MWTSFLFQVNCVRLFLSIFCTLFYIEDCSSSSVRQSIDRTTLHVCVSFGIFLPCLLTHGLSSFSLLTSMTPDYFCTYNTIIYALIVEKMNHLCTRCGKNEHLEDTCTTRFKAFESKMQYLEGRSDPEFRM